MTLVMKFGGTSVGSADAMRRTAELILQNVEQWGSVVVVVSAMGSKPIKVTDLLLNGANSAAAGDQNTYHECAELIHDVHFQAIDALLSPEKERQQILASSVAFIEQYKNICQAVSYLGELSPRALDTVGGMGERMSAPILSAYLREIGHDSEGIDATELIVTDSQFQNAAPDFAATGEQTRARLQPILDRGGIPIVTGFIGANEDGVLTTLGRGGSDYSASILGQALSADEVWIWTDVDGVMSADPRIIPNAVSIPKLTYREVSELAYYGASVLHPKTMRPVVENGIPLRIKNTFNPEHDGTVIVRQREAKTHPIEAVTAIKDLRLITVEGKGMMGVPGIAARTFGAAATHDVNVLLITQASSEQSICFVTPSGSAEKTIHALSTEFAEEIANRDIDRIWAMKPVSILTVVGAGMRGIPGISGRVFTALNPINIIAIAQGSSECSISVVINEDETTQAVELIHTLIVGD